MLDAYWDILCQEWVYVQSIFRNLLIFYKVEMHVAWRQEKLRRFCKDKGIHVSAWSPLAANGASWGSTAVMDSPILKEIAQARGTTVAQVLISQVHGLKLEEGKPFITK